MSYKMEDERRFAFLGQRNDSSLIGVQETEWLLRNGTDRQAEYLAYRYKFKYYPKQRKHGLFPLHLLVEPASICNLRCPMCFQSDPSFRLEEQGLMDIGFFRHLVDQAVDNGCQALTLAPRGEPTLHLGLGEMLAHCKGKFFEIKINTNATKLDEDLCHEILEAGVDIVVFSVDSSYKEEYERIRVGAKFETVLGNIKRFVKIRNSRGKYRKTSAGISGVYLGTQSKEDFLDFWGRIVDTVAFVNVMPIWDTYHNEPANSAKPCGLLWERMYVWFNGICNPCAFDCKSKLAVGDAKETSLTDIWTGEPYNRYRALHLQGERSSLVPCNLCNVF